MLFNFVVLLVVVAVFLMILSFKWESLTLSSVTFVLWIGLSIGIYQVEIPYQAITSSDSIVTGTHTVESLFMYGWLFMGLAIIMFLYIITLAFNMYKNKERRIM